MPNDLLAVLCSSNNGFDIRLIDILNGGKLKGKPLLFDKLNRVDVLVGDDNNLYGFTQNLDASISVQKLNVL